MFCFLEAELHHESKKMGKLQHQLNLLRNPNYASFAKHIGTDSSDFTPKVLQLIASGYLGLEEPTYITHTAIDDNIKINSDSDIKFTNEEASALGLSIHYRGTYYLDIVIL